MKRRIKNIIFSALIILVVSSMVFTMFYFNSDKRFVNGGRTLQSQGDAGQPPEMSNGGSNSSGQPPEMPNGGSNSSGQPPEMPNGESNSSGQPPEMPNGESNSSGQPPEMPNGGSNTSGQPPEMPNGGSSTSGQPPEMPSSNNTSTIQYILFAVEGLIFSLLLIYWIMSKFNKYSFERTLLPIKKTIAFLLCIIILTIGVTGGEIFLSKNLSISGNPSSPQEMQSGTPPNTDMSSSDSVDYNATETITENATLNNKSYESSTENENALLVSGDIEVKLSNSSVNKSGDSNAGDNASFYGINSAVLAKDGATLTLKNIKVNTNAVGANGVFSYGGYAQTDNSSSTGTSINISNSEITTEKDASGGLMTTGGGITNASNLIVTTAGRSSAAIRTDRGGGTVTVDGGTYKTTGIGSPSIYSTADVTVKNAKLISTASEGVIIEGKNSVNLENITLTDTNTTLNGQSTSYKNIFLYQSMSGDADSGTAEFSAKNSDITTNKGDTFYITNTTANIDIENNNFINTDPDGAFLRAKADSWGTSGSNGGEVVVNMKRQAVKGDIVVDNISTLNMNMKSKSSYQGAINTDKTARAIALSIDKSSTLKLTGDSYVTSLVDEDTSYSNIDFNGYKLFVNGVAIN